MNQTIGDVYLRSTMATKISSHTNFENDCKEIYSCVGLGRLNHLVQVLASRTQKEGQEIRETYMAMYGQDLINHLQNNNQRSNEAAILCMWMLDPHERDALVAREALGGGGGGDINYKTLVEIFVGRKSSHILLIKQAYLKRLTRNLEQDIIQIEPPHSYQRILVALAASHKAHHADVSQHIAQCDARRLLKTTEGGSIEEATVVEMFTKRSIPQMKLTLASYKHIYGHDYTKVKLLIKENPGEFQGALKTVMKCMYNPAKYYAKTLYASIKGMTKDKGALTRVMVSRAEVDMDDISRVFKQKYGMELREGICESIPSGEYREFLVALATKFATCS